MGIVRTVEWRLVTSPEETDQRIRTAFERLDLEPDGPPGEIIGRAKRSFRKNRWAAEVSTTISALSPGSMAVCRVDMVGNKHFALLSELAEQVGDDAFDDQGAAGAIERLGKASKVFERKEVRHLRNILRASETVLELGQGQYETKQGLVVLTDERLFFFEKSLGSETVEEFPLGVINSLSISKKMTGETLRIFSSGKPVRDQVDDARSGRRAHPRLQRCQDSRQVPGGTGHVSVSPRRRSIYADRTTWRPPGQGTSVGRGVRG